MRIPRLYASLLLVFAILLFFLTFLPSGSLIAQMQSSSEAENYTATRTTDYSDWLAGRTRIKNRTVFSRSGFSLSSETELSLSYDQLLTTGFLVRELYADFYLSNTDIRAGRQKLITGGMEGVSVADILSPSDLNRIVFLNSDDIRVPLEAVSITRYLGNNSINFIAALHRPPSALPDPDSRWSPFSQNNRDLEFRQVSRPKGSLSEDLVFSLRYQVRGTYADYSISLMNWIYPVPSLGLELISSGPEQNPELSVFESMESSPMGSATLSLQLTSAVRLNAELLYVHQRYFTYLPFTSDLIRQAERDPLAALQLFNQFQPREDRYLVSSPWVSAGAGIRLELSGYTAEIQFATDFIADYQSEMIQESVFTYSTLLFSRSFMDDRLRFTSFNRYNISGVDLWSHFELLYEVRDNLELSSGMSLFGGKSPDPLYGHLSFGQFRQNSFLYTRIRYFF